MEMILSLQKMNAGNEGEAAALASTDSEHCSSRSWFACTSGITVEV